MLPNDALDGDLGALDVVSTDEIRSAFTGLDALVEKAGFPNLADPHILNLWFSDGTATRRTAGAISNGTGGDTTAFTNTPV